MSPEVGGQRRQWESRPSGCGRLRVAGTIPEVLRVPLKDSRGQVGSFVRRPGCLRAPGFEAGCLRRSGNPCGPMYRHRTTEDRSSPQARTATPALIDRSLLIRFAPRRPASSGGRAVARSLRLVRERAVRARSRVVDHPTCTGVNHEPTAQPTILRQRLQRSAHPAEAGPKLARPPRPPSTCERIRGRGGPRAPLRDPDRGQRLDHGRGPAADLDAGVRRARPMARRGARRRRGERRVSGGPA